MRILLVEDDRMIGTAVAQALKDACYAVDWVVGGQTAIEAGKAELYDLVLLDLGLPGLDGLEVLRRFRTGRLQLPVIVMTARDVWFGHGRKYPAAGVRITGRRDPSPCGFPEDRLSQGRPDHACIARRRLSPRRTTSCPADRTRAQEASAVLPVGWRQHNRGGLRLLGHRQCRPMSLKSGLSSDAPNPFCSASVSGEGIRCTFATWRPIRLITRQNPARALLFDHGPSERAVGWAMPDTGRIR